MDKQRPFEQFGRERYGSNKNSNYGRGGNNQNRNQSNQGGFQRDDEISPVINKINSFKKLELGLTSAEVNLPDGLADTIAKKLKQMNTNQLYKFYAMVKEVESYYNTDFNGALNQLYSVVPLVAYSVGRKNCPRNFYELLKACISPDKIKDGKDIKALIDFLEAIVAYFKFYEGGK